MPPTYVVVRDSRFNPIQNKIPPYNIIIKSFNLDI
jgi:hypothetical protein